MLYPTIEKLTPDMNMMRCKMCNARVCTVRAVSQTPDARAVKMDARARDGRAVWLWVSTVGCCLRLYVVALGTRARDAVSPRVLYRDGSASGLSPLPSPMSNKATKY